jgi:hypothetical protein
MCATAIISLCTSEITVAKGGGRSGGGSRSSSSSSRPSSRGSSTIASRPTTTPLKSNPLPSNNSNALALPAEKSLTSTKLASTNSGPKASSSEPKISNPQSTASAATAYPPSYTPTYYSGYGYNHPIIISNGSHPNNHTPQIINTIKTPTWQDMLTDRNLAIAAIVTPIAVTSITAGSLYAYYKYTQAQALKKQSLAIIAAALQNSDTIDSMVTTTDVLATNQSNSTPATTTYSDYPKAIIAYWTKYFKS